ncbi:MAG: PQQ-binding-like beta-propeller repeat protein [Kiritimatiellae bacterium]|nr:PQQ-binding-like beta-propeller repeat protein [Kiritimatiellia bacterium]MDD5520593.1 PQQ-binding-like beta-propeller repeat protein [Kiritimatiellia bacterium]
MRSRNEITVGMIMCLFVVNGIRAADNFDWPQFRGPDRDGISRENVLNPKSLSAGPKITWKINVGNGWSSVSICGDKLFTMGNVNNKDIVYAVSVKEGKEIWRHSYPCDPGNHSGPRTTPTTDGKAVYSLSRNGDLFCLNIDDGKVIWEKNILRDGGGENIEWGIAGSPVIYNDMLLMNAGEGGVAFDRKTGTKIWSSGGKGGYSTPVVFKKGAMDCVALFSSKGLCVVEARTGKQRAFVDWKTSYDVNAADPVPVSGKIFISSGYNRGCALIDISGTEPKIVWENKAMRNHFSSCVLFNGDLYGIDGNTGKGTLKCLDPTTGKEKWAQNLGFGGMTVAGDKIIMLNESGDLFIAKAVPDNYGELASAKGVLTKTCWTAPVFCRGTIFCRNNKGDLVAVDVSK